MLPVHTEDRFRLTDLHGSDRDCGYRPGQEQRDNETAKLHPVLLIVPAAILGKQYRDYVL